MHLRAVGRMPPLPEALSDDRSAPDRLSSQRHPRDTQTRHCPQPPVIGKKCQAAGRLGGAELQSVRCTRANQCVQSRGPPHSITCHVDQHVSRRSS
jgi:hypothetical protein